ncbi:MAG: YmdB family metallophosphoesterase [Spirochaetales bacterium]|nr:YmdB family metallophosphoesterase [Spirochaetales bacterium]
MIRVVCIGDIVGDAGLEFLEYHLPDLVRRYQADCVIANAENLHLSPGRGCGMSRKSLTRLFDAGVTLVTGGNHSWEGPEEEVHEDPRVIRPLNMSGNLPGRGRAIVNCGGMRLGVVNIVSSTAAAGTTDPYPAFMELLEEWQGKCDMVFVDFHGESVMEKMTFAFAVPEPVVAVVGTHTHVATEDLRIINSRVAYVSDVGMTGPGGGLQGYAPDVFTARMKNSLAPTKPLSFASGPVELGAVVIGIEGSKAVEIFRVRQLVRQHDDLVFNR